MSGRLQEGVGTNRHETMAFQRLLLGSSLGTLADFRSRAIREPHKRVGGRFWRAVSGGARRKAVSSLRDARNTRRNDVSSSDTPAVTSQHAAATSQHAAATSQRGAAKGQNRAAAPLRPVAVRPQPLAGGPTDGEVEQRRSWVLRPPLGAFSTASSFWALPRLGRCGRRHLPEQHPGYGVAGGGTSPSTTPDRALREVGPARAPPQVWRGCYLHCTGFWAFH